MPSCSGENLSRFWNTSPPTSRRNSTSPPSPGSPLSASPPYVSSMITLKRSASVASNASSVSFSSDNSSQSHATIVSLKRSHSVHSKVDRNGSLPEDRPSPVESPTPYPEQRPFILTRLINWYLGLVSGLFFGFWNLIGYLIWTPALWASSWLCLVWIFLQLPLTIVKWILTILYTPAWERARNKRCVLISGGSTVQAVHLARNFAKAGARVVVCEVDGLFGLARFSTACSQFYRLPKPGPDTASRYVKALKDIVLREKSVYYIPVCGAHAAYYDALAKPHLESIGCECFIPGAADVAMLDDPLELMRRCRYAGLPTPVHLALRSSSDVSNLYERGTLRTGEHVMLPAGPAGMRDRANLVLPPTVRDFRTEYRQHEISERRPWIVIRDPGGTHYLTCTTVKESKVVANVTCRVDNDRGLIPEDQSEVLRWLERFFSRSSSLRRKITGHFSFRLAVSEPDGDLVSIGCRVGLSLPYICQTSVHPRLVWRPCKHFSRQNSGNVLNGDGSRALHEAVTNALKQPIPDVAPHLLGNVLDKREALFVYWDPLPYCAYYHLQLPFRRISGAIRAQPPGRHAQPLALVQ